MISYSWAGPIFGETPLRGRNVAFFRCHDMYSFWIAVLPTEWMACLQSRLEVNFQNLWNFLILKSTTYDPIQCAQAARFLCLHITDESWVKQTFSLRGLLRFEHIIALQLVGLIICPLSSRPRLDTLNC
jgi:hypothetical protein